MSEFAVRYRGEVGTFGSHTEAELVERLDRYRSENPEDPEFIGLSIWERKGGGTVGAERSVWDFINR